MINNIENLKFKKALIEDDKVLKRYDMKNLFLTDLQKAAVECWYQLPIGIFSFVFLVCLFF